MKFFEQKFKHPYNIDDTDRFLEQHPELDKKIEKLIWAYHEIGDVIPQYIGKLWSGHNFPYNESYYEIECSLQLTKLAFYKYAFIALRNSLELGMLSVYWDRNDDAEKTIQNWYNSNEDTPRFTNNVLKKILDIPNLKEFSRQYDLVKRTTDVFWDLSNYNHTKGYAFSGQNLNLSNFTRFNENAFLVWVEYLEKVVRLLLTVHILKYPVSLQSTAMFEKFGINEPWGTFLDVYQSEQIKEVLEPDELQLLQQISDNDENAKGLADWVNSFPDITEEEIKKQFEEFNMVTPDKTDMINGFIKWHTETKNQKEDHS